MQKKYLGDSYDAVKRLWASLLADVAPLYADPEFIPEDFRKEYSTLTMIEMLSPLPEGCYSILNDPDTGIRLPGENNQAESRTHVNICRIKEQSERKNVFCVITYDQSDYRHSPLNLIDQHRKKLQELARKGLGCFYYESHAPFLFSFTPRDNPRSPRDLLIEGGIPEERILDSE